LQQIHAAYKDKIAIVPVALDGSQGAIEKFGKEHKLTFSLYWKPESLPVQIRYIPTVLLVSADGTLVDQVVGLYPDDSLKKALDAMIK